MNKQIVNYYSKISPWGKVLVFIILFFMVVLIFKRIQGLNNLNEGFEQTDSFLFKSKVEDIYDPFYADIYDSLVFNNLKTNTRLEKLLTKLVQQAKVWF